MTSDAGGLLKIHRARIRTTHLSLRDKSAWAGRGRATIDPNHSPQVEGDHYLTAATPAQQRSVEAIVADAQHDLIRRAHPPAVLTDGDTAGLARDYPHLVATLGLDDTVLAELAGGERDVFTAACTDQLSGLHGPEGQPCPARPWVCLLCPLAIFAPRHAASLLRLKAFFSRQWQQMPAAHFMAVFGPYSQRISLAPPRPRRRHPKLPPDGAREKLLEAISTARDRLVVAWLADGGFRIGELCGLHLADLHLRDGAGCGQCRAPHVHVCHRDGNPNRAAAKTKHPWRGRTAWSPAG